MTGDEMFGWHHQLDGHAFGSTPWVGDGQGSLVLFGPWGRKELDRTDNWTELNWIFQVVTRTKCKDKKENISNNIFFFFADSRNG